MKKYFLLFLSLFTLAVSASAQRADLADGYYRVGNAITDRYIYVMDNTGSLNASAATADMGAIVLYKNLSDAVFDPSTVLYIEKHGDKYDITAQATGIYQMISTYVNIIKSPLNSNAYCAYGSKSGISLYLVDPENDPDEYESWLTTSKQVVPNASWYITPIENSSSNYFGIKPAISHGGKYYQPFYADFPFTCASSGMKVYYISKVDERLGCVVYKEITGVVPRSTPVIIECSSDNPANNKLNIGGSASNISDNKATGVYFEFHLRRHENYVTYDKNTMRSLGVTSDGKLGVIKGNYSYVPRNQFYVPVSSSAPDNLRMVSEAEYETIKEPVAATGVTLNTTALTLTIGDSQTLTATVTPDDTTDKTVTWSSSNSSVASVDSNGKVTAVNVGTATITATCGNVSATCQVTVKGIEATSVTLNQTALNLHPGESSILTATVAPDNTTDKTVNWSSSNTAVATVDSNGKVTAVASGTATITARCGNVSATCQVTVTNIEVTSVTLNQTALAMHPGDTSTLTATVAPDNATVKTVAWTSSNTAVATVDSNGKVTAVAAGTATITATSGSVSATCQVTVTNIEVASVTLNRITLDLHRGDTYVLTATVAPENATVKTVNWTSSNPDVATVDAYGKVTAIALGEATITATSGSASATCTVYVSAVEVESVTLNYTALELVIGEAQWLNATVLPANAEDRTVTWTSSNTAVATVNTLGFVEAISVGQATITASAGGKTATCVVTVKPVAAESVTLNKSAIELTIGMTETLTATVYPANTTDPTVEWSTSDSSVATVDANGKVTANAVGEAIITAACGDAKATCRVSVTAREAASITLNHTHIDLLIGETETLVATVTPEDADDKTVIWASSNETVATVTADGVVKAIAAGNATISATCGAVSASCSVTVNPILAESVTLDATELSLYINESAKLNATVAPDNTTDKNVVWASSNADVVVVDAEGNVMAVGLGEANVTASCGAIYATCHVTVLPVMAESVILDKTEAEIETEDTLTLTATVVPDNTTDKSVTWISSDPAIATVTDSGLVTGISEGEVDIIASCGEAYAVCHVKVNEKNGICDVIVDADGPFDVYKVNGMKVRSQVTSLAGLPSGVYLVNGVKYFVK